MQELLNSRDIHNATVLVFRNGEKVGELSKGGMTIDSPFAIASISKLYTHAMIFQLIDQEKLHYDTKLTDLLPEVVQQLPHGDEVTVRHMIDQTSGLANYEMEKQQNGQVLFRELIEQDRRVDFDEALKIVQALPARFRPGEKGRAHYADVNAMLMGRIIEELDRCPLPQALETHICRRLDLKMTHFVSSDEVITPIYYSDRRLNLRLYLNGQMAQGGIVATNRELMAFLQAFFGGELFDPKHIDGPTFRRIQFGPIKYGSGMVRMAIPRLLSPLIAAPEIIGHSGVTGSFAFYCPSRQTFITGTINQAKGLGRPFKLIYRILSKIRRS